MDTSHPVPPVIEQRVSARHLSLGRFFAEIAIAGVAGMAAIVLPVLFVSHPHLPAEFEYHHVAFFPLLMEAAALPTSLHCLSYGVLIAICLSLGFWGRGPVWLIGPAVMLVYPIWSFIDLSAGGDMHQLWPFEMAAYGVMSLVYIIPTGIGRLARHWTRHANHSTSSAREKLNAGAGFSATNDEKACLHQTKPPNRLPTSCGCPGQPSA